MNNKRVGKSDDHQPVEVIFKVALASPSDVLEERRVFFQIVSEVNRTLRETGQHIRLEPLAWENTYPDAGVPQRVIIKQLLINECDIFVGVFWKWFGTPTGETRADDGQPYLSGTEQEIEEAFEARRKSKVGRPTIMLYWKRDPLPSDMKNNDYLQYAKVIEFFKECGPGGRHQALFAEFRGDEFGKLLKSHLFQAVTESGKSGSRLNNATVESELDPKGQWLGQVRLTSNPFEVYAAEQEPELEHCYLLIGEHRPSELVREPKHWVLFAGPGCGKTALARMVEPLCYPKKSSSETLYLRFGQVELQRVLGHQSGNSNALDPQWFLRSLMQSAAETIRTANRQPTISGTEQVTPANQLAVLLENAGLRKAICILDQVDELAAVEGDPARIVALLKPIMVPAFRNSFLPHLALRYFLPEALEARLTNESKQFRLDRCRVTHLTWEVSNLRRLIQERMRQYADPPGSYTSLGELCDPGSGFAAGIDLEIAELAEGCPRAALWLANRLIEIHCKTAEPTRLIQLVSWHSAKQDWWHWGRKQFLGAAGVETFWLRGSEAYFGERPVRLTAQNARLMRALIEAGDPGCSKDELKEAGWPGDSPEGVTTRSLDEAVRRLRLELTKGGFDAGLVQTVHGHGYRLLRPQPVG